MKYIRIETRAGFRMAEFSTMGFLITTLVLFLIVSCSKDNAAKRKSSAVPQINCENITKETVDDCIRLNQIQVLGTHNSYKLAPTPALTELLDADNPGWADNIRYEHRPLKEQLGELGIRQLELDIFADPEGGLYAEPAGAVMTDDERFIRAKEMLRPGFKVMHSPDVDYRTTCLTLKACLTEIRDWSSANPTHLPILIMIEIKDRPRPDWGSLSFVTPVMVDESLISEIDEEIWDIFSQDHVITPDEVRGDFPSLEKAVLTHGWPTLAQSRGRVLFGLDNTDEHRDRYLSKSPNLKNRAMFTSSGPGEPTAAFIKMNNAINNHNRIKERILAGYIIRTRSDIPLHEARTGDTTRREAALTSGAQYISTDYPEASPFGSGYVVTLPDTDNPGRCNPISAPPSCRDTFITE